VLHAGLALLRCLGGKTAMTGARVLVSVVMVTPSSRVIGDGVVWINLALYSSSISLSAACFGERPAVVGSGGLDTPSRSIAMW
jgi:hypothetical protein